MALQARALHTQQSSSLQLSKYSLSRCFPRRNVRALWPQLPRNYPVSKDHFDRFAKMVRNDQSFADGFAAFGDYLTFKGDLHLGFLANTRAMVLKHQNPVEIRRRRRTYLKHVEAHVPTKPAATEERPSGNTKSPKPKK